MNTTPAISAGGDTRRLRSTLFILLALAVSCLLFVLLDQAYNRFINTHFPDIGSSMALATLYGIVSRLHLILPLLALAIWQPRLLGLQMGKTRQHWRMILIMLVANCGLVAGYLILTGNTTPYSGNQWLFTEVVTVPLVEETMWRGAVFAALLLAFGRVYPPGRAAVWTVWAGGFAFGLLHGSNALVGVPLPFVAVQVLNATVWGVVYGYARARTGSLYPPILLHAAMNLVVVLM